MTNFPVHRHDFPADRWSIRRYRLTVKFLRRYFLPGATLLDLGTENGLGNYMKDLGYNVINTDGGDFDLPIGRIPLYFIECDCVTAFEVLEHLIDPFCLLQSLPGKHLVASIPLKLWFAPAFWNKDNPAGRHFHEMEKRQFLWLLDKSGWRVVDGIAFTSPSFKPGFRTILRWFTPRFYIVYAIRK
jgi:hypothetical protein